MRDACGRSRTASCVRWHGRTHRAANVQATRLDSESRESNHHPKLGCGIANWVTRFLSNQRSPSLLHLITDGIEIRVNDYKDYRIKVLVPKGGIALSQQPSDSVLVSRQRFLPYLPKYPHNSEILCRAMRLYAHTRKQSVACRPSRQQVGGVTCMTSSGDRTELIANPDFHIVQRRHIFSNMPNHCRIHVTI